MQPIDWAIVGGLVLMVITVALWARRYNRSVADFMVGNRCAGRYMLAVANGMGWFGAVTIMSVWQRNYEAGITGEWWRMLNFSVTMLITLTGFVVYRRRETRAMTLAQLFQIRYSRNFRIFAGLVCFIAGILNFGIFPFVTAQFFVYFCELPVTFLWLGIEIQTFWAIMFLILTLAVLCDWMGGQIAVMLTDFFQGIYAYLAIAAVLLFLFVTIDWGTIGEAAATAETGKSIINPFDTARHGTFTWWYFLIMIGMYAYGTGAWQGTSGYNAAARTPHEQRMATVMGIWRIISTDTLLLFGAVAVYTMMNHPTLFADIRGSTQAVVNTIEGENIRSLMIVPIGIAQMLPAGLRGVLAAMVLAACISTLDTALHSWGTMFIQDVVMPWRKKPFAPKQHMLLLKISIVFVAVWALLFSILYTLTEPLALFFGITGAIFGGGAGSVIIGGLYWKRGRTAGAWGAMIVGSILAVGSIVVRQVWPGQIAPALQGWLPNQGWMPWNWNTAMADFVAAHTKEFPINSFYMGIITALCGISVYVILSLLKKEEFNLDRMLHRGKYALAKDTAEEGDRPAPPPSASDERWIRRTLKKLGLTEHFTLADKFIFGATIAWSLGWGIVFLAGTAYYLTVGFDDSVWLAFWKTKIWIMFGLVLAAAAVFIIGGMIDLKAMIKALRTIKRDDRDDGMVIGHINRDELSAGQSAAGEAEAPDIE